MKRSMWVRLIAVILVISMLAAPVSAAPYLSGENVRANGMIGAFIDFIRDLIEDIFDDWFDKPGEEEPAPTDPIETTSPTTPGESEPTEPGETVPGETKPTTPGETKPTEPGETEPEETEPEETEPEEKPEYTLNLEEGHENSENGQLLRGVTYTLSQLIAQQSAPATVSVIQRIGTLLTNGRSSATAPYALRSSGTSTMSDAVAETEEENIFQVEETTFTNWVDGGKYYIQSARASYNNVASWIAINDGAVVGVATQAEATEFTLTINDSNTYYLAFQDGETTKYLSLSTSSGGNGEVFTTEPVAVTIKHITPSETNGSGTQIIEDDGNLLELGCNGNYLNQYGGKNVTVYGAHNGANDNGNSLWFHQILGDTTAKVEVVVNNLDAKVVMFPVTMFDINESAYNIATHNLELKADPSPDVWNGVYFSDGTPGDYTGMVTETSEVYTVTLEKVIPSFDADGNITNLDAESEYILINRRSKKTVIDESDTRTSQSIKLVDGTQGYTGDTPDNTLEFTYSGTAGASELHKSIWKYGTTTDGSTAILNADGEYLKIGHTTSSTTADETATIIQNWTAVANCVAFKQGSEWLSDYRGNGDTVIAGWHEENDGGHPFYIYKKTNVTTTVQEGNTVEKTFTGVGYADYNSFHKNEGADQAGIYGDMFYTGMVEPELDKNGNIVFKMPEAGIFSYDKSAITAENNYSDGVKNVYEFVGMPFILNENGVYSFDSDENAAYFKDTDGDTYPDPAPGTATDANELQFDIGNPQPLPFDVADGSDNGWFPYNIYTDRTDDGTNNPTYGTNADDKSNLNYHFGMRADLPFSMTANGRVKEIDDNSEPITFTFSGDDDVWIFIDGKLVVDLGGLHNRFDITLNFAKNRLTYYEHNNADVNFSTVSYNERDTFAVEQKLFNDSEGTGLLNMTREDFASDETHTMQFFYLERGAGTSNCRIEFNLPMRDTVMVTKQITHSWSQEQDEKDGEKGDGTAPLTPREQAAVDKMNFYFKLWKKTDGNEFEGVANTNFILLDSAGNKLDVLSTDGDGVFTLKNGQTAKFMTNLPRDGVTYYVEELKLDQNTFLTPDYMYAGLATHGFDYTGVAILKDENGNYILDANGDYTSGTVNGHVSDASTLGEHELPMDVTALKSYEMTVKGSVESIDTLHFKCINYLNAQLPNATARAYEDIIVIDYGLRVRIDPMENDLFRGEDVEIVAWGDESLELNEVLIKDDSGNDTNYAVPHGTEGGTSWTGNKFFSNTTTEAQVFDSGNVTFNNKVYSWTEKLDDKNQVIGYDFIRDTFDYELTKQMTEVEEIRYIIKVNSTDGDHDVCRYALGKIYIVPATIMYYEENFSNFVKFEGAGWDSDVTVADPTHVSPYQEPGVVGTVGDSTYGSDAAYLNDDGDSNGTYRFGDTTNKAIRFTYTFTGTGTSIFARISDKTGYMQIKLYKGDTATGDFDTYYRDTYYKLHENNTDLDDSGSLFNIPVYTLDKLPYGTYTVVCTVARAGAITDNYKLDEDGNPIVDENGNYVYLGSGNEFYLDGIRVMQPLNEDAERADLTEKALEAYDTDGESNLEVVTLREKLLTDYPTYDPDEGEETIEEEEWPFVVMTDTNGEIVLASDYKNIGPKEEVYLMPGQSISFSLYSWEPEALKLYMGMKAPFGTAKVTVGDKLFDLYNAPDCYYDVTTNYATLVEETDEEGNTYYTATYTFTATQNIVSLTNIKIVGNYEFTIIPDVDVEIPDGTGEE